MALAMLEDLAGQETRKKRLNKNANTISGDVSGEGWPERNNGGGDERKKIKKVEVIKRKKIKWIEVKDITDKA